MTSAPLRPDRFAGGCACGDVRYECDAPALRMVRCYCRDCQRAGGGGHSPSVIVSRESFRLVRGEPRYFETRAQSGHRARRAFCGRCGSPLFAETSGRPGRLALRAGNLDDPGWFRSETDAWADSAQPWDRPAATGSLRTER